jgi:uroporphyrinogen decarboxylase
VVRDQAKRILVEAGVGTPHIFNLGHGITPDAPVETVAELVRFVHEESRRLRTACEAPVVPREGGKRHE